MTLVATVVLGLVMTAAPAMAHAVVDGPVCDSPGDYAQNHVVPTARHGLTDEAHGPGIGNSGHSIGGHLGFAGFCSPGNTD